MQQLPVQELHAFVGDAAEDRRPLLLDVREPWEFELASIQVPAARTLHIPMGEIPSRLDEIDRERPVVCICHHGVRSLHVAHYLHQQGWPEVINLRGGIDAWSAQVDPQVPRY